MKKIQAYARVGGVSFGKGVTDDDFEREMNLKIEECVRRLCEEFAKHRDNLQGDNALRVQGIELTNR